MNKTMEFPFHLLEDAREANIISSSRGGFRFALVCDNARSHFCPPPPPPLSKSPASRAKSSPSTPTTSTNATPRPRTTNRTAPRSILRKATPVSLRSRRSTCRNTADSSSSPSPLPPKAPIRRTSRNNGRFAPATTDKPAATTDKPTVKAQEPEDDDDETASPVLSSSFCRWDANISDRKLHFPQKPAGDDDKWDCCSNRTPAVTTTTSLYDAVSKSHRDGNSRLRRNQSLPGSLNPQELLFRLNDASTSTSTSTAGTNNKDSAPVRPPHNDSHHQRQRKTALEILDYALQDTEDY